MPLKKIFSKLNGLHYPQEFLCLVKESHTQPLQVYVATDGCIIKDITNLHLFVGYHPLIFAFASFNEVKFDSTIQLVFSNAVLALNVVFVKKDALATIDMKITKKQVVGNGMILYYEGINGAHTFLTKFHQYIQKLNNRLYNNKAGNVFLEDNLYKQVQIAYAVPRIISLITVGKNNLFNLFPTDLHGQVNDTHYVISLRSAGKACEQVLLSGEMVISQMHCNQYKTVYSLGKNHMQELRPAEDLPLSLQLSKNLRLPLPENTLSYHELILEDAFVLGIHKIFLFRIAYQQQLPGDKFTLAHIHNSYATWRYKNKLPGNYLHR